MKYQLFTYQSASSDGHARTGIAVGNRLFDWPGVARQMDCSAIAQDSIDELLEHWAESHALLRNIATRLTSDPEAYESWLLDAKHIYFHAPLARPGVIYAAGANYRDHVEAMGRAFNMKLVLDPKSEGVAPWHF